MKNTLTLSTECYDEALTFLINKYGINSSTVEKFFYLGKTDKAVRYAIKNGYTDEN